MPHRSKPIQVLPDTCSSLPVIALAEDVSLALIEGNVLLQAEPGAGKSTALPLALLLGEKVPGRILLLEPRRLAARQVATRLASHLFESVGQRIGIRMRGDTRVSSDTQLEVVTEGVLTRLLQQDPALEGVSLVIFDEFHERSLHADLGLALCLEVQRDLRHDLRLLLMSATLQSQQLSRHLTGIKRFHCKVRQHSIRAIWLGDSNSPLPQRIAHAVWAALQDTDGDVLVFLPGMAEINRCTRLLQPRLSPGVSLHVLHSRVSTGAQAKATAPADPEIRRVILATSLAETSITIDGVRVVVDSGLERRSKIDSVTGAHRLETVTASQASAIQRAGRAGRTAPGVCYRLWSEAGHSRRSESWEPEIRRADLTPLLLELGIWGTANAEDLPWLEAPPSAGLARAASVLTMLGLWKEGQPTAFGKAVSTLPVHPRLGHMVLWASRLGASSTACRLAVSLEDTHVRPGEVDLECALDESLPRALQHRFSQLQRSLAGISRRSYTLSTPVDTLPAPGVLLAQAFPDWVARRRSGEAGKFLLACGAGVVIDPEDPLAHSEWLAVAHLGGATGQLRIFKALQLSIQDLEVYAPELFSVVDHIDWHVEQQRVIAERRSMIGNIQVSVEVLRNISDNQKAAALLAGIRKQGLACLPWTDECRQWQARVLRISRLAMSRKNIEWPEVDDDTLNARLEHWLQPWLQGVSSLKALQQVNLMKALCALLDYQQQTMLDQWFPTHYQVPSGSRIALTYLQPGPPVLSVRLQEMLGCNEKPSIAQGAVILKVELLSPARRPVQVTTDLPSFWRTSYPAVKKEMAGRYPKHVWPDEPWTATPTTKTKRRQLR